MGEQIPCITECFPGLIVNRSVTVVSDPVAEPENGFGLLNPSAAHAEASGSILDKFRIAPFLIATNGTFRCPSRALALKTTLDL